MSMSMTSFSVVSLMAMVPESECRMPTLMVSSAAFAFSEPHRVTSMRANAANVFLNMWSLLGTVCMAVRDAAHHHGCRAACYST